MDDALPLEGVRILDFSRVLAGPFCTMMLADLGADVVKVEEPSQGDETRRWGPPWAGPAEEGRSAYYLSVNRNKRSLALDLGSDEGRRTAWRLAGCCQVVVENFLPARAEKLGVSWRRLQQVNPRLVHCSITGFGQGGPDSGRAGYDYVIQAMSGLMSITGPAGGPACKVGVAISDVIAGLNAATAILAALRRAERTGRGEHIDISLLDCQVAALVNVAANYLVSGKPPRRQGNQHPNIVPYQTFAASDGDFVVAVGNDRQFRDLCRLIGHTELTEEPRFATNPARSQHRKELIPLLQSAFGKRTLGEWMKVLLQAGIPAGPIHSVAEALDDAYAQGLVQEKEGFRLVGSPLRLGGQRLPLRRVPPRLGEQGREVLQEWLGEGKEAGDRRQEAGRGERNQESGIRSQEEQRSQGREPAGN